MQPKSNFSKKLEMGHQLKSVNCKKVGGLQQILTYYGVLIEKTLKIAIGIIKSDIEWGNQVQKFPTYWVHKVP